MIHLQPLHELSKIIPILERLRYINHEALGFPHFVTLKVVHIYDILII